MKVYVNRSYVITILLLESLLLAVFLVLDILLFYVFFESILPPLLFQEENVQLVFKNGKLYVI
jgi:NADH:ubiquinone oxidoreductase subunit 4 (subunit M)